MSTSKVHWYCQYFQYCCNIYDGGPSSALSDLSRILENLAQIKIQRTDAYRSPKIPKFFCEDPVSLFVVVVASFRQAHIRLETTKANYLLANLDHDLIPHIKHILELKPKLADLYTEIKIRLISIFCVSEETRSPSLDKVRAITEYSKPKTVVELRRFLGMVNFYRKSLKHAAEVQAPLQKFICDSYKNDKRLILRLKKLNSI